MSESTTENAPSLAQLYAALSAAQGEFRPIIPDRTVEVTMKSGGKYSFSYATLGAVLDACRGALAENGLSVFSTVNSEGVYVVLAHASGERVSSFLPLVRRGTWQEYGSDVTYARRYMISAILGVASEWDDDGAAGAGNESVPTNRTPFEQIMNLLDAKGVSSESEERRAWICRVVGRNIKTPSELRDVDLAKCRAVAEGKEPMPAEVRRPTDEQRKALNDALAKLAPWGAHGLDGLTAAQATVKKKNSKMAWISAMVVPPRRVPSFSDLTPEEADALIGRATAGEMPAGDKWMWSDVANSSGDGIVIGQDGGPVDGAGRPLP